MKKLLVIVVLGLTFMSTTAFFHNPKDKALENCADFNWLEKVKQSPSIIRKLSKEVYEEIYDNKDLSIARGNIKSGQLNETNAINEWETFAKDNFWLSEREIRGFRNVALMLSFGLKESQISEKRPELKLKPYILDKEEKMKKFDKLFNALVVKSKARIYHEKFLRDNMKNVFVRLKLKKKFKEKSYQINFENCEIKHNKIPSTFMQKWGD